VQFLAPWFQPQEAQALSTTLSLLPCTSRAYEPRDHTF
jgi:hypothetical protein